MAGTIITSHIRYYDAGVGIAVLWREEQIWQNKAKMRNCSPAAICPIMRKKENGGG